VEQHNLAPDQKNQNLKEVVQQRQSEIEAMASMGQQQSDRPDIVEDRLEDLGYKM
jgi:predicted KAP-like P-loop ATPase